MTGVSTSCGACKFLRRKCTNECVFAPYFRYDQAAQNFAAVHRVFGASNASRLLLHLPEHCRSEAAIAMSFEAVARMQDPVYGCVSYIYSLQQQVANLQEEIETLSCQVVNTHTVGGTPGAELQFPLLPTDMDMQQSMAQQERALSQTMNTVSEELYNQMIQLPHTAYELQQKRLLDAAEPGPSEMIHAGGLGQQMMSCCHPWVISSS